MDTLFGNEFKEFICQLLALSNLKKKYINQLVTEENMRIYQSVFTHISKDPDNNYEFYEILGDVTLNKAIVWYIKERFPFLHNAAGVKIIARLRINMVSKKHFSAISEKLGFAKYIQAEDEYHETKQQSLLEDVFEAFFGATEFLLDKIVSPGAGYGICFRLIKTILDQEPISLRYEDLYDPITRLKETFDFFRPNTPGRECPYIWGTMKFENTKQEDGTQLVRLFQVDPSRSYHREILGTINSPLLDEGKHVLCTNYLRFLEEKGFKRPIPEYYASIKDKI
jgi:hypothetical protein